MTKFEEALFDFNESVFGTKVAVKVYCFCSDAFTAFCYTVYLMTLPFQFVYLLGKNLRKNFKNK